MVLAGSRDRPQEYKHAGGQRAGSATPNGDDARSHRYARFAPASRSPTLGWGCATSSRFLCGRDWRL